MVEGARLESVYRSKAYRGFESLPLRKQKTKPPEGAFLFPACRCKLACKRQLGNKKEREARLCFFLVVPHPLGNPAPQNENEIENEYVCGLISRVIAQTKALMGLFCFRAADESLLAKGSPETKKSAKRGFVFSL